MVRLCMSNFISQILNWAFISRKRKKENNNFEIYFVFKEREITGRDFNEYGPTSVDGNFTNNIFLWNLWHYRSSVTVFTNAPCLVRHSYSFGFSVMAVYDFISFNFNPVIEAFNKFSKRTLPFSTTRITTKFTPLDLLHVSF